MSRPGKTLDDIDDDDDYVPSSHYVPSAPQQTHQSGGAFDDFFGGPAKPSAAPMRPPPAQQQQHQQQQAVFQSMAPPPQQQKPKTTNDFFDDFFGGPSGGAKPPASSTANTNVNMNTNKPTVSDGNFLDLGAKAQVQRHVTSDPLQYLDMATGGGNKLRPKSTLGNGGGGGVSSGPSIGSFVSSNHQIGSGGDNGTAHILGNPFLLARMTHYDVLGVSELIAEAEEINKAYKKKCLTLHPDRVVGRTQTSAEQTYFKAVVKAYECLNDPAGRADYDSILRDYRSNGGVGAPLTAEADGGGNNSGSGAFGGGGDGSNNQNCGGWDFLDDDANKKDVGLGDFAPTPSSSSRSPPPSNGSNVFFAPSQQQQQQQRTSVPQQRQQQDDGWGAFSGSSSSPPSQTMAQQQRQQQQQAPPRCDGNLFAGTQKNTIDDLFS